MESCPHAILTLLPPPAGRMRCRRCHLTLSEAELERSSGCCPECLETSGVRQTYFEPLPGESSRPVRYRCEQCGLLIGC